MNCSFFQFFKSALPGDEWTIELTFVCEFFTGRFNDWATVYRKRWRLPTTIWCAWCANRRRIWTTSCPCWPVITASSLVPFPASWNAPANWPLPAAPASKKPTVFKRPKRSLWNHSPLTAPGVYSNVLNPFIYNFLEITKEFVCVGVGLLSLYRTEKKNIFKKIIETL